VNETIPPKRSSTLEQVSNGPSSADLARLAAYNFWNGGPWAALALGVQLVHGRAFFFSLAGLLALGAWGLFKRIPDTSAAPAPGVWMTSRMGLWRRVIDRSAPLAGAALSGLVALVAGLKDETAWAVAYLLALGGVFAVQAVVAFWSGRASLAREIELRIDDQGLYSRGLNGTLSWGEIREISPRQRGDQGVLRLVVGPNTAPGLSTERQMRGGAITVNLADAGASRESVVTAMIAARPSLNPHTNVSNTFVLPIEGVFVDQPPAADDDIAGPLVVGLTLGVILSN
jgi:hypothetical protein